MEDKVDYFDWIKVGENLQEFTINFRHFCVLTLSLIHFLRYYLQINSPTSTIPD